ncbi:CPBP family intramembrane metalloprotease [Candidatus Dependentiae bacterium]|nr:CPBP family intramembrane metalloprotease [Candidatus Dependentiae bacterium]
MIKKITKSFGPIILSALSIIITFKILQPFALFLDPSFNLLSSRGIGKVAFISLVILQIILFLATRSFKFFKNFLETNIYFFKEKAFLKRYSQYFVIFFLLHSTLLILFYFLGFATYNPNWETLTFSVILRTIFGFIVTFFLAWTEELIFRGTLFPYFEQTLSTFSSLCITSLIFMFVHDMKNPLNLITKNWELGLGLFLLGFLLNLIFIDTRKLYTGMGAHAGLVFVKVILRRMPFLIFLPSYKIPFWVHRDLRQSNLIHLLFIIAIFYMIIKTRKKLFDQK